MSHQAPVPLVEAPRFATGPSLSQGQGQFPKHSVPGWFRRLSTEVSVRQCCARGLNGTAIDVSGSRFLTQEDFADAHPMQLPTLRASVIVTMNVEKATKRNFRPLVRPAVPYRHSYP